MTRTLQGSRWFLAGLLGGALVAGVALGQDRETARELVLEPDEVEALVGTEGLRLRVVLLGSVDADRWQTRLASKDFEARELAFQDLVLRALKDRALFAAVQQWAISDAEMPGLAWTARLALREMRHRVQPVRVAWVPLNGAPQGSMHQGLRSVEVQPLTPGGERSLVEATSAESLRRIEVNPRTPLEATQHASLYAPRVVSPRAVRRNVQFHFQPEGVTVVMTELGPNGPRERRYAADSVQALVEEHPELRLFVPGIEGFPKRAGSDAGERTWLRAEQPREPSDATLVLGVKCTTIPLQLAEARLLGPGVGLLIERREPGTLAEELDLRRGDILVEVAGRPVCSPEEISRALAEREGLSFEIKIIDRNGRERILSWMSSRAPAAEGESGDSKPER